jgi:hypothetical protein
MPWPEVPPPHGSTRVEGQLAAYKAELIAAMARDSDERRSAVDPDEDRLPGVGEFFPAELAMVLNCSRVAARSVGDDTERDHPHHPAAGLQLWSEDPPPF